MTPPPLRTCAVIPTYNHPQTLAAVVARVREHLEHVIVVDDGSAAPTKAVITELVAARHAMAVTRPSNGGKGAAVLDGLREAARRGFSHALQIDADGQHATDDIPRLLNAAAAAPCALVLAAPRFDDSAPRARRIGRQITRFWTRLEAGRGVIDDPMCGFRVYPLALANAVRVVARRMDFDIEIAVRMVWAGAPVVNVPSQVRYLPASEGGVSHFRMLRDNLCIAWMHTRLMHLRVGRWFFSRWQR